MSTAGVLVASREVRLNHGDYALLTCMASSPGQVFSKAQLYAAALGGGVSAWDHIGGEYYLAFEEEVGGLLVFGIHKNDGGSRL